MKRATSTILPAHLPGPFPDPKAYALAYELVRCVAGVFHGDGEDWHEVRLPAGLLAEAVYRRLPSALVKEKKRIAAASMAISPAPG